MLKTSIELEFSQEGLSESSPLGHGKNSVSCNVDNSSASKSSTLTSHLRLRSLRAEVADILRESTLPRLPHSPSARFAVSKADSRPSSPTGPASMLSLSGTMRFAVLQFVSSVEVVLSRADFRFKIEFYRRIHAIISRKKACGMIYDLMSRKTLNSCFHAVNDWSRYSTPQGRDDTGATFISILPIESVPFDHILAFNANPENPHLKMYAGLGKVVGVIISIHRMEKLSVIYRLDNMRKTSFHSQL